MRSFLAILLSEETRKKLAQCTKKLKAAGADVKWVEEDNFHITLSFFGEIDRGTCDALIKAMPEITKGLEPFPLSLYGIGAFPSLRRPRVIWAGVREGSREIIEVHRRVLPVTQSLGFSEDKKFSPHITLGRVRSQTQLERLLPLAERIQGLGEDSVKGISLMESSLTPRGPEYSELAFAKLINSN